LHSHSLVDEGAERFESFSRTFSCVVGSVGATFSASRSLNVKVNLSRGYRAPNLSELGSNGVHEGTQRYELGNQTLRSESSWQTDVGLDYTSGKVAVQVALFANRIGNYIFSERVSNSDGSPLLTDGVPTYRFTQGDARLLGGEASIDWHRPSLEFGRALRHRARRQIAKQYVCRHWLGVQLPAGRMPLGVWHGERNAIIHFALPLGRNGHNGARTKPLYGLSCGG